MERRLGKGLSSLLGEAGAGQVMASQAGVSRAGVLELAPGDIHPNPFQPRKHFDLHAIAELKESIRNHGFLQPVVVRRTSDGFQLISGERRWRAATELKLAKMPAILRDGVSDGEMLELALVENVQRRDLDPIERARGFKALQESLQLTQEAVAAKVGLRRSTVANHIRLLDLPEQVQAGLAQNMISMGHARALLGLESPKAILDLFEETVRGDLSVREVERRVRESTAKRQSKPSAEDEDVAGPFVGNDAIAPLPSWATELERRIREKLGTKVTIVISGEASGKVILDYYSRESLDRICEALAPRPRI